MLEILPHEIACVLNEKLDMDKIYEIRIRADKPVVVNALGLYYYLTPSGISGKRTEAIIAKREMIDDIIFKASNFSIYSFNDQIKQGFITIRGGYRIGIAGETVNDKGNITTIKNYNSVNIRIPHFIKNAALTAYRYVVGEEIRNTLIISPPGAGKTTILRDLLYQFSEHNLAVNNLVLDERYEIASCCDGHCEFEVGDFTDVISGCSKSYGFENGIRSMRPDVIFTDEIGGSDDIKAIEYAAACGVKVIATIHGKDIEGLKKKPYFETVIKNKLFSRFIILSTRKGEGTYEGIYDENFSLLYRD